AEGDGERPGEARLSRGGVQHPHLVAPALGAGLADDDQAAAVGAEGAFAEGGQGVVLDLGEQPAGGGVADLQQFPAARIVGGQRLPAGEDAAAVGAQLQVVGDARVAPVRRGREGGGGGAVPAPDLAAEVLAVADVDDGGDTAAVAAGGHPPAGAPQRHRQVPGGGVPDLDRPVGAGGDQAAAVAAAGQAGHRPVVAAQG